MAQTITPINHNPGIIIEKIAQLATSNTDWKIVQKIDLEPFFRQEGDMYDLWHIIKENCAPVPGACAEVQEAFVRIQENSRAAEHILELLQGHNPSSVNRKRRSVLPFVGRISRILFGTLDEDALDEVNALIETSANETRKLAALLATQTELIETKLNTTNERVTELRDIVTRLANENWAQKEEAHLRAAISAMFEYISKHALDLEIITNALLFASQGVIHPYFISPRIIQEAAATVRNTLSDVRFPLDEASPTLQLFPLVDTHIIFSRLHLVYYIVIPLLDPQRYSLFKSTPLPVEQRIANTSGTFAYIWPSHTFVAFDSLSNTYISISPANLAACKKTNDLTICLKTDPVREIKTNAACELKIIAGMSIGNPSECLIKITRLAETHWTRLHAPNTWAFSAAHAEKIFLQCRRGEYKSLQLRGTGILNLGSDCKAHTADARLTASRELGAPTTHLIITSHTINLANILAQILNATNTSQSLAISIPDTLHKQSKEHGENDANALETGISLQEIAQKARALAEYNNLSSNVQTVNNRASIFGISSLSLLLIALASGLGFTLLRRCGFRAKRRRWARNSGPYNEDWGIQLREIPSGNPRPTAHASNTATPPP